MHRGIQKTLSHSLVSLYVVRDRGLPRLARLLLILPRDAKAPQPERDTDSEARKPDTDNQTRNTTLISLI